MFAGKVLDVFKAEGREVKIRYPEMKDLEDIMDYMNSVIKEGKYLNRREKLEREEEIDWLSNTLKSNENGNKIYLAAVVNGEVLGGASVKAGAGAQSHIGEFGIALHKDIRGLGIGTKLSKNIFAEAKERLAVELVKLEVFETNERARDFYKKLGFEKVGELREAARIDGNYQNSIIMQKRLD